MKNKKQFDLKGYKPPYLMWYERDFRAKTMQLTWLQRLLYRALLQSMYSCETRPSLPNNDKQLWQLAGAQDLKMWKKHKSAIIQFFKPVKGNGRLLQNTRMNEEWLKATDKVRTASKAGNASANKCRKTGLVPNPLGKNGHAQTNPNSEVNVRSTNVHHTDADADADAYSDADTKEASAAAASPAPASPLTGASSNLASAATASAAAAAAPSTPAPLPEQTGKAKLGVLVDLAAKTIGKAQNLENHTNEWAAKIATVDWGTIAAAFAWAATEEFWMKKVTGRYAVNNFCKNLPTILKQYGRTGRDQVSTDGQSDNWPQAVPGKMVRKIFDSTFVGDNDWRAALFNKDGPIKEGRHRVLFIDPAGKKSADPLTFEWTSDHWNIKW